MDKEKDFKYSSENNDEVNMVKEEATAYGLKRQGEYTLEDYYAIPDDIRVELIDGVIYDMSAPTFTHQDLAFEIAVFKGIILRIKKANVKHMYHQLMCNWIAMTRRWYNLMLLWYVIEIKS